MSKTKQNKILGLRNFILLSFAILITTVAFPAYALPLVPCGTEFVPCTPCHLFTLADRIIDFVLKGLALPILVIALLAGGIVWVTASGNPAQIEKGRKILTSSLVGIFIAFGAWLIVDTIIVTLGAKNAEFKVGQNATIGWAWNSIDECPAPIVTPPTTGDGGGIKVTPLAGTFQTEAEARAYFKNLGFTDSDLKQLCPPGQTQDCLNLVGLPKYVADRLWTLQTACGSENCQFRISSGTEGGHQTHGVGQPVVDIVPKNLQQSTLNKLKLLANDNNIGYGVARCEAQGGASVNNCAVPPANHIHVSFPPK